MYIKRLKVFLVITLVFRLSCNDNCYFSNPALEIPTAGAFMVSNNLIYSFH